MAKIILGSFIIEFMSIEDQIILDPEKGIYRLSMAKKIKRTTFKTLIQLVKIQDDSVTTLINLYNQVINVLIT